MPYEEIQDRYPIPDVNTTIWRYLKPYKFQYLVEESSIYFTQVEQFPEEFQEGLLSTNDLRNIRRQIFRTNNKNPYEEYQEFLRHYSNFKKSVYISCWMASDTEHEYMWTNFLSDENGVVIRTTVQGLQDAFNNSPTEFGIYISETLYFEPHELIGPLNLVRQFSRKPNNFDHEQEIRAIIQDFPYSEDKPDHLDIEINLDDIIDEVRLSPNSDREYQIEVEELCREHDLTLNDSELR